MLAGKNTIKNNFLKTTITITLLLVLVLNLSSNIFLVSGDAGGTGKFLTIQFQGEGDVTATKVQSGEVRTFTFDDSETFTQRVGAGTVELLARPNEGWEFSRWIGKVSDTESIATDYKTEKYGEVTAVFVRNTFTITVIVATEAPSGYVETLIDGVLTPINDQLNVIVDAGASQMFSFYPDLDNHVSSILIDNTFVSSALDYTFSNVQSDHIITVFFSLDGEAYVPAGTNIPVYLGDYVSLNFISTQGGGTATQEEIILSALLEDTSLILWNVNAGVNFEGVVEITLPYTGFEIIQHIFTSYSVNALYSDVNADGVVNGDDVSDVANAIKTLVPHGIYDADFDVDRNEVLDQEDVHMVNANKGALIESLNFWIEGNILFIETDHFSIFRGR